MRKLNIGQVLKTFEGKPFKDGVDDKAPDLTLKRALLAYFRIANLMELSEAEQTTIYEAGLRIGASKDMVEVPTAEYDVIKKITDKGKYKEPQLQNQEVDRFGLEVRQQVKRIVDEAVVIKEEKKVN